jgi:hypothetical protein
MTRSTRIHRLEVCLVSRQCRTTSKIRKPRDPTVDLAPDVDEEPGSPILPLTPTSVFSHFFTLFILTFFRSLRCLILSISPHSPPWPTAEDEPL